MKTLSFALGLALAGVPVAAQQAAGPQLIITSAVPDRSGATLTIKGGSFGGRPFVTLDLIPLTVQIAVDSEIVAVAPVSAMPPGDYLLSVSRGPSPAENGSFTLTLGTPRPAGDAAPRGPAPAGSGPGISAAGTEPAAQVGARVITISDVDREWQRTDPAGYLELSRHLYDMRRHVVDTMVADELIAREAAARGVTVDALLKEEIPKRVIAMPESAVVTMYQGLGDGTRGASLDQMRPALRAWLQRNTEPELAKIAYVEELTKVSTRADTFLMAPRVEVEKTAQDAPLGPAKADVEFVAFGDFYSSDYVRFAQAFGRMRETFGDRVRLVFKHAPPLGPESITAAEAAACANAQGKFWLFHDALVAQPGSPNLDGAATAAGVNRSAFTACVESGEFREVIRQSRDEAERYGIGGPSFLVNGRLALTPPPFLPPFDFFKKIIEEELGRIAKGASR